MALRQKILDEFLLLRNNRDTITRAVLAMDTVNFNFVYREMVDM